MYVQAVLLVREGLKYFDPGSDLLIDLREPAQFVTWRKQGRKWSERRGVHYEKLPHGSSVLGVFLADDLGNISYAGVGMGSKYFRDYVASVLPKVKEAYQHTRYNRLFAPPSSALDLVDKLRYINVLYYGLDYFPKWTRDMYEHPEANVNVFEGIKNLYLPPEHPDETADLEMLAKFYGELIQTLRPNRSMWGIAKRPVYEAVA